MGSVLPPPTESTEVGDAAQPALRAASSRRGRAPPSVARRVPAILPVRSLGQPPVTGPAGRPAPSLQPHAGYEKGGQRMSDSPRPRWRRRLPVPVALAAAATALLLVSPASAVVPDAPAPAADLGRAADEQASVVEVRLAGTAQLDSLVDTGVDLDHHVTRTEDGLVVHAVVTPA